MRLILFRRVLARRNFSTVSTPIQQIPHYKGVFKAAGVETESSTDSSSAADIEVWIPESNEQIKQWADKHIIEHPCVIGFDAEWKPAYSKGTHNKVALVQLATTSSVLLVQLHKLNRSSKSNFPAALAQIIESNHIIKVGVGVLEDLKLLYSDYGVLFGAYHDIGTACRRSRYFHQPSRGTSHGLKSLAQLYLNITVDKPKKVRMGNWERNPLSVEQIRYAAYDALVSRDVYSALERRGVFQLSSVQQFLNSEYMTRQLYCSSREKLRYIVNSYSENPRIMQQLSSKLAELDEYWLSDPCSVFRRPLPGCWDCTPSTPHTPSTPTSTPTSTSTPHTSTSTPHTSTSTPHINARSLAFAPILPAAAMLDSYRGAVIVMLARAGMGLRFKYSMIASTENIPSAGMISDAHIQCQIVSLSQTPDLHENYGGVILGSATGQDRLTASEAACKAIGLEILSIQNKLVQDGYDLVSLYAGKSQLPRLYQEYFLSKPPLKKEKRSVL